MGAAYLDGIIRNKPESAETIGDKLHAGVRLAKVPQRMSLHGDALNTYRTMIAISDLDMGVVARRQGGSFQSISDEQFISMIFNPRDQIRLPNPDGRLLGNVINDLNGADIVMHGSLHNGLINPEIDININTPGFRRYLYNEHWFLFNGDGWLTTSYANNWISRNLPDIWASINNPS